jgi:dTDP-4-dehydrorhamnose reductase
MIPAEDAGKKIKVLITGSNGLLGQSLSNLLLSHPDNYDFLATSNKVNLNQNIPAEKFKTLDIVDYLKTLEIIKQFVPDVIVHTAAKTNVDDCELKPESAKKVNIEGARNIAIAAKEVKAHLIHLSTDFVFDGTDGPYDESDIPAPQSVYARSKWESEQIVTSLLPKATILRTALVFGWAPQMSRTNFLIWVKSALEYNRHIKVVCDQFRTPTFSEDLAYACLHAIQIRPKGIFHVSGSEFYSVYEFAQLIAEVFGLNADLIEPIETAQLNEAAKRPYVTGFEIGKASRILHYSPTPLKEALEEIKQQMVDNIKTQSYDD